MKYDKPGAMKPARIALAPRNKISPAKRVMRDCATKGSPPMEHPEFKAGFRRCE
jgi:hypothetical protein